MAAVTAAVVVMAAGLAISAYGQYKQYQAQKKQQKAAKKERNLRHRKAQREAIRRGMIAQAQIENTGAQVGGGVGNVSGGARSAQSQAGANVGFIGAVGHFQDQQAKFAGQAAKFGMVSQFGSTLTSIGSMGLGGGSSPQPKQITPDLPNAPTAGFGPS